jgi:ribosomal protein L3
MGTKAGMTTVFTPEGLAVPCTVIALEEGNIVSQVCALHGNIAPCICLDAA